MIKYYTPFTNAMVEQTIEKSRFLGHISPVNTKSEADEFIDDIRRKFRDANHNVPVIILGEKKEIQWASDDGEPRGTAGPPILNMLIKENITNLVLVVTRYFGGIKLGTGGLVRAYTSTAQQALDKAELAEVKEMTNFFISFDYTFLSKIEKLSRDEKFYIRDIQYEDVVKATLVADSENSEKIKEKVIDLTSGKSEFISEIKTEEKQKCNI